MSLKKANHYNEKKIVFCSRTCKKNLHETYDGEYGSITKEVKTNTRKNPYNYDFILIVSDDRKTTSLKEQYDEFILDADALKEATKGFINMYKTGYITNTARNLFATLSLKALSLMKRNISITLAQVFVLVSHILALHTSMISRASTHRYTTVLVSCSRSLRAH